MNKNETKYQNTARLMDEALLRLLEKKEYEFVTVKEICQKAGVNRTTFYLHYEGMDDLLREAIDELSERFYEVFDADRVDPSADGTKSELFLVTPQYLKPYLNFILQNKIAFRLFYSKPKLFDVQKTFDGMYKDMFEPILCRFGVDKADRKYVFAFYSGAVTAVIRQWVQNNYDKSVDDMVDLITDLMPSSLVK